MPKRETYARLLSQGLLDDSFCRNIIKYIEKKGMKVEELPQEILVQTKYRPKLKFWVCRGNKSWEGLVVGFPGTKEDLSTENFGTPNLRKLLYPMLLIHRNLRESYSRPMPCLYLVGERFNDVFLRKFRFLSSLVPHVMILTRDLLNWVNRKEGHKPEQPKRIIDEHYLQWSLCRRMDLPEGLVLPSSSGETMRVGLLSYEVPTVAGTWKTERLDILGYDHDDHSLVALMGDNHIARLALTHQICY